MREDRLLERVRTWENEPERRGREDPRRIVASVLRHLQRILNTKQGNVPIAEDYGVPDFTDVRHFSSESLQDIERSVRQTIQKYEPRLKTVRVSFVPQEEDKLALHFQITARLVEESKTQVLFETILDPGGKIDIRG